jgi:AP-3 complex subunit mu
MMDNGMPFTTEPNALMEIIPPATLARKVVGGITGQSSMSGTMPEGNLTNTPWRKQGVKYAANEIYFDVIEEVDCIIEPYVF